ncbi:alcohol dehydrogenase catalytic domain-containing protein [Nocardia sp. NPDC005998]|uniref:alcohol dehydrogenase catalytic domain-containing protein n=1 Tax=Nocardia sp. NPDC005998 TaxID=3156894 RepID=UPI0033A70B4E
MRAVVYSETGPSSVLRLVQRPEPIPGPGEVAVRVMRAGVNPTDWKFRAGLANIVGEVPPGQDGAGVVQAVGAGVERFAVGDRVWLLLAQHGRAYGTATEVTVQPVNHVAPLPEGASFDLGASLGTPFVTAHRVLTSGVVSRLAPGSLAGQAVHDITAALADNALHVGEHAGLPLHHYDLPRTAAAHDAVEDGAIGKVLLDLD